MEFRVFQKVFQKDFQMTSKRTFKRNSKLFSKGFSNGFSNELQTYVKKHVKHVLFVKNALQNKLCLGQLTAKPACLNVFVRQNIEKTKQWFYSKRSGGRRRRRSRRSRNKDTPRYTLISRRVTHARNANTNTKHDFPVGVSQADSPLQPPIYFKHFGLFSDPRLRYVWTSES